MSLPPLRTSDLIRRVLVTLGGKQALLEESFSLPDKTVSCAMVNLAWNIEVTDHGEEVRVVDC